MKEKEYSQDMCLDAIHLGEDGKSPSQICKALGVSAKTKDRWIADHSKPEFKLAMEMAHTYEQAYWEHMGYNGTKGTLPKFNATSWQFIMKNRFKKDYKETTESKVDITSNVKNMTDEQIDAAIEILQNQKKNPESGNTPATIQ